MYSSYVAADVLQLIFDPVIAAGDMSAGIVDDCFAFGTQTGENQRSASAKIGRSDGCAGQIGRAFYDGNAIFYADMRAEA